MTRSLRHNYSSHPNIKRLLVSLAIIFASAFASVASAADDGPDYLKADTNILFLGDSITQGGTYIAYLQTYLWDLYPDRNYNLINLGLGSETASGLSEDDHPFPRPDIHTRIDRALAEAKPDLTFICYGMNDGIYHPPSKQRFQAHKKGMEKLINKVKATGSEIILLTPPPFDAQTKRLNGRALASKKAPEFGYKTPYENYDSVLEGYGKWVIEKRDEVALSIDIHTPLKDDLSTIRKMDPTYRYGDGVHPNDRGHYIIARTILKALNAPGIESLLDYSALPTNRSIAKAMPLILERHRFISAAWREHVGHSKPNKETVPPLSDAIVQAKSIENEIRAIIKARNALSKKMNRRVGESATINSSTSFSRPQARNQPRDGLCCSSFTVTANAAILSKKCRNTVRPNSSPNSKKRKR